MTYAAPLPSPVAAATGHVSVPEVVAARALASPDTVAVSAPDATVSYAELLQRADDVAAALRAAGGGPGSLVAVCLPRSAELVIAWLGVARAGGVVVALDPANPPQRIATMVQASGAQFAITTPGRVTPLTPDRPAGRHPYAAYVVYTSGSTGEPKGVVVGHRGLANLACWHREAFGVGPGERCSQIAGPGFDAAAWEIWGALAAGASLHVAPPELVTDPPRLRDWLVSERITVSFLPTLLAAAVTDLEWPAETALRVLLTGGDRLHHGPPAGLPFALVNNYGLSEASVVSTSGVVPPGSEWPTIGSPIAGVECLVVDGELLIGGVSLADGYLGAPELTKQRFVELAAANGEVRRWYRTGDRVRIRPDGEFDYLGRIDDQVQVSGHRVEPAEVAACLERHPAVRTGVVLATDQGQLVAFWQPSGTTTPNEPELRDHLSRWLPMHMLPAALVCVSEFPLTSNGKIDRTALLRRLDQPASTTDDGDAVHNELQRSLMATLAELLAVPSVGPDDNFLLLGGHSLLGAQLVARIAEDYGVEISLRSLFEQPTAAAIAARVHALLVKQIRALDDAEAAAQLVALD